jgi:hypothetical protein
MLQQTDLDAMGMDAGTALRTALDQTISDVLVNHEVQEQPLPTGDRVLVASAEGVPYVSAGVTSIPQLAGGKLRHGALVGVPRHSMIMILPVRSRDSLTAVSLLSGFVESMYQDAPDACAPGLYWFVDDDAFPISAEPDANGQPQLVIAPQLQKAMKRLRR